MIRVAVIGCGRVGQLHCLNVINSSKLSLASVFDANIRQARYWATRLNVTAGVSIEQIARDAKIDAVIIASPTKTHTQLVKLFAKAGKFVFCEKPLDTDLARAKDCMDYVAALHSSVQMGFNRRFDPGHANLKTGVTNGDIGDLQQVIISSRSPDLPAPGYVEECGGMYTDMTIHDFDMCRFLLDEEPTEIYAMGHNFITSTVQQFYPIDSSMLIMRTRGGKMAHVNNSRSAAYGHDQRIEAFGSKGMLISDNRTKRNTHLSTAVHTDQLETLPDGFLGRYAESYVQALEAFANAIEDGSPFPVDIEDGYKALRLAKAANLSISANRPIQLDELE